MRITVLRRIIAFFIAACFLAAGCSFGRPTEKIYFLLHNSNKLYGSTLMKEFGKIADEHGFPVIYLDAKGDVETQIGQLKQVTAEGAKLVVLLATDEEKIVDAVEEAAAAGVKIVSGNRHVKSDKVFGVYSDEKGAGRMQAEYMERNLPTGAHVFYLAGAANLTSSVDRLWGFKERCLAKRPDIRIVDVKDGNYYRENGKKIMEQWLQDYFQIDAVVCANDEMALGAMEALKEAHREKTVMISGIDAIDEALEAVEAGEMRQTIKQDPQRQAQGIFQFIEMLNQGKTPESNLDIPLIPITKDNVAQFRK